VKASPGTPERSGLSNGVGLDTSLHMPACRRIGLAPVPGRILTINQVAGP
jgi:hypothetical protein